MEKYSLQKTEGDDDGDNRRREHQSQPSGGKKGAKVGGTIGYNRVFLAFGATKKAVAILFVTA